MDMYETKVTLKHKQFCSFPFSGEIMLKFRRWCHSWWRESQWVECGMPMIMNMIFILSESIRSRIEAWFEKTPHSSS